MGIWIITNNMTFHTEGGFDFEQVLRPLLRIIIIITVIRPYRTTTIRKAGFGTRKPRRGKGFAMISDSWRISRRPIIIGDHKGNDKYILLLEFTHSQVRFGYYPGFCVPEKNIPPAMGRKVQISRDD